MNTITKMFALVLYQGKTNENGIVERTEVFSLETSITATGENVNEKAFDDIAAVIQAGISQFFNTRQDHAKATETDIVEQGDPLRGRAHGLTPHPDGENETQRFARHEAEMTRQEGYQHGRNGELPVYTDDTIYMEGYHTGVKDIPR